MYRRYKHESKVEKLSAGKESGQINTQRKPSDKAWAVNKMFKTTEYLNNHKYFLQNGSNEIMSFLPRPH